MTPTIATTHFLCLWLLALPLRMVQGQVCQACLFDGHDHSNCVIYGKVGDQVVEWSTASSECKGYYDIAIDSIDPQTSCSDVNSFVNSLRFGDLQVSESKLGLGVSSEGGAFFVHADGGHFDLAPSITIQGETTNCEASANDCYNAMKLYFHDEGVGAKEMDQVCETLYNKVRLDKNMEESVLRNRLCMEHKEGSLIIVECDPLAQQVKDLLQANPDRDCSAFGFETPLSSVPGCEDTLNADAASTNDADATRDSSVSGAANTIISWTWTLFHSTFITLVVYV